MYFYGLYSYCSIEVLSKFTFYAIFYYTNPHQLNASNMQKSPHHSAITLEKHMSVLYLSKNNLKMKQFIEKKCHKINMNICRTVNYCICAM